MSRTSQAVFFLGVLALVGTTSCVQRLESPEYLNVGTWKSPDSDHSLTHYPERDLPSFKTREDIGVAFSGGGTRSAACVAGQLRALHKLEVLDRVQYISAVSGGAWGAAPYAFFDPAQIRGKDSGDFQIQTIDELLGRYRGPADILPMDVPDHLRKKIAPERGAGKITEAIAKSTVTFQGLFAGRGDEGFAEALSGVFLERFGLGDREKFFTFNEATRDAILARNQPGLQPEDFYLSEPEGMSKPFFIANAYITMRRTEKSAKDRFIPVEMTPQYVGVRTRKTDWKGRNYGGGFYESFGYDSKSLGAVSEKVRRAEISQRIGLIFPETPRFSLGDVLSATGCAPMNARFVSTYGGILTFPEFYHWPIQEDADYEGIERSHNDGGAVDNLGIMPLLARGVKTIYAFNNSSEPHVVSDGKLDEAISTLFGIRYSDSERSVWKDENCVLDNECDEATGYSRHKEIIATFDRQAAAGLPLVHDGVYKVCGNAMHGVPAGGKVRIVFFMLGATGVDPAGVPGITPTPKLTLNKDIAQTQWYRALPDETKFHLTYRRGTFGHGRGLRRFPFYGTFFSNPGKMIDLSLLQSELLAHYSAYAVMENCHLFR